MAKNNKVTKKRVVKIEATGMAFVKASFNNVIVSLTNNEGPMKDKSFLGHQQVRWALKAQRRTHHTLLRWLLKTAPRLPMTWDYAKLKFM